MAGLEMSIARQRVAQRPKARDERGLPRAAGGSTLRVGRALGVRKAHGVSAESPSAKRGACDADLAVELTG
eukprot:4126602-Pleurochrysis_carterae.AAC.1